MRRILLSTAYLAPIQYYTKLLKYDEIYIEACENFIKQTYRNRCKIYSANGELSLTIPVKKIEPKTNIKDIRIDYDTNWRKIHWKSIESAYKSSPFFEYYQDELIPYYTKKYNYLIDFNTELQSVILSNLDILVKISFTKQYISRNEIEYTDMREAIHPKKKSKDAKFRMVEYTQVFQKKYGFIPNLSILDLLFNEGPNASEILKFS